jgi:hypothetical protein
MDPVELIRKHKMTMTAKQYLAKQKEAAKLTKALDALQAELAEAATTLRATVAYERRDTGTVILIKGKTRATFTPNSRGRYSFKLNGSMVTSDTSFSLNEYRLVMALGQI